MNDRVTPESARRMLAATGGQRYVTLWQRSGLELEYYQPLKHDPQEPHTRDEVYFVISGRGWFVCADQRFAFGPGDVLFVPAGVAHRFEDFSEDFATWAIFVGAPED
jgi:mannose-6-phosphate isomerase-like protein (cupin superfamily)